MLVVSGTPLIDDGRYVSSQDHFLFVVEIVEADRLKVRSRDKTIRGWLLRDQVVPIELADARFDQMTANDPRDAEAFWNHARLLLYRNDLERALANVNQAIRRGRDLSRFYETRAVIQLARKQIGPAIDDCNQAIRIDPQSPRPYAIRASAWLARNDMAQARTDLERAIRLDPVNPGYRAEGSGSLAPAQNGTATDRGVAVTTALDRSEPAKTQASGLTPAELLTHGNDRLASGDNDRALADFGEAIKLDPNFAPAYAARAQAWAKKHYRDREILDFNEAIRHDPGNAKYRIARAESWSAQGMHKSAMADFEDALRIEPNNPAFWVARGNEWRRDLKLDDAIADYTHALQIDPRYAPAYIARGNAWKQRRDFDRAIQEFSYLIRLDPENAIAYMTLGRMLATVHEARFRNGKLAVELATRACELTRWQDPDCLDTLAAACAETDDYDAAIKWQSQAIKLIRQNVKSPLQQKAVNFGGRRGIGFDDRLGFYKSKKPTRE